MKKRALFFIILTSVLLYSCVGNLPSNDSSNGISSASNSSNVTDQSSQSNDVNLSDSLSNQSNSNQNSDSFVDYYTVTWKNYDGSILKIDNDVSYGEIPTYDGQIPTKPYDEQYSYTFNGWTPEITPVVTDVVYTAVFTAQLENIKISFDLNGGLTSHSIETIYRPNIQVDDFFFDVTKENYNFRGWTYNGEKVFDQYGNKLFEPTLAPSMIFEAAFAQDVILCIKTNIPDAGIVFGEGTYSYNTNVDINAIANNGYSFVGWFINNTLISNKQSENYSLEYNDIILEARFMINSYNLYVESVQPSFGLVSIEGDFQFENKSQKVIQYNDIISISAYTNNPTYSFLGWFDSNGNLISTNNVYTFNMPYNDYYLYAKWNSSNYNVTITTNIPDGGKVLGSGTYQYGSLVVISAIENIEYRFVGWYMNEEYISYNQIYSFVMPDEDVYIEAHFEVITYTITYELAGGVNSPNNPSTYNYYQEVILDSPTRDGCTFNYWLLNGEIITKIEKGTHGNLTILAVWDLETIYQPFNVDAKIMHYFFDPEDSIDIKSQALISYDGKFIPSIGIDYTYNNETFDVIASFSGKVIEKSIDPLYGLKIGIQSESGLISYYSGLSNTSCYLDEYVQQGDIIGYAGTSVINESLGNHLHFELKLDEFYLNPLKCYGKYVVDFVVD